VISNLKNGVFPAAAGNEVWVINNYPANVYGDSYLRPIERIKI